MKRIKAVWAAPVVLALAAGAGISIAASGKSGSSGESPETATAIFAGGCFWCTESDFEHVTGVIEAVSGYTAGDEKHPSYRDVSAGRTGHTEAVKVIYDPKKVSYSKLLDVYWHSIDPTVENRQFCDSGTQYRTGIYYQGKEQEIEAKASLTALENSGKFEKIYTEVQPLGEFYPAEDYHQNYYKVNPVRYKYYRYRCGRDQRLQEIWGKDAGRY
ncbi:peptide-methionine (S)-S-oxide reductase MsrA [Spongorhabdus nitratireducens]